MLDYDREAAWYDETRGGAARAGEAARAVLSLVPGGPQVILDLAGGTGIVAELLSSGGAEVVVADRSHGMLARARERVPGRVIQADATRLPVRDASVDVVTAIWFLHLVDYPDGVLAEVARVLPPGGRLITTVDKAAGEGVPLQGAPDAEPLINELTSVRGMAAVGSAMFVAAGIGHAHEPDPVYQLRAYEKGTCRRITHSAR